MIIHNRLNHDCFLFGSKHDLRVALVVVLKPMELYKEVRSL